MITFETPGEVYLVNSWGKPKFERGEETAAPLEGARSAAFRLISKGTGDAQPHWPGAFVQGRRYKATVTVRADTPVGVAFFARTVYAPYTQVDVVRVSAVPGRLHTLTLDFIWPSSAEGDLRLSLDAPARIVFDMLDWHEAELDPPFVRTRTPATWLGLHSNKLGEGGARPWVDVGAQVMRLWDTRTCWRHVEPEKGRHTWDRLDLYLQHARTVGAGLIYTFGVTPTWALANPADATSKGPYGAGSASKPQLAAFGVHVDQIIARAGAQIRAYEPWNEVDTGIMWDNTMSALLEQQRVLYAKVKAAYPNAVVLSPNVTTDGGISWLTAWAAIGGMAFCDAISVHINIDAANPESAGAQAFNFRTALLEMGHPKPIWDTECKINNGSQLGPLSRGLLALRLQGIEHVNFYTIEGIYGTATALAEGPDYTRRTPLGDELARTHEWLAGKTVASFEQAGGVNAMRLTDDAGVSIAIQWQPAGRDRITAVSGESLFAGSLPLLVAS